MSSGETRSFSELVELARNGDREALNHLLADCRGYLDVMANHLLDDRLRAKCAPSDVVQDTMCNANSGFQNFRGDSIASLKAWLREILRNEVAMTSRHYFGTAKRDIRRENDIHTESKFWLQHASLPDSMPTPSSEAVLQEDAAELRAAMLRLPDDYRSVLLMRNWERLTFSQIATRVGRSENAVKKLWARALAKLESELFAGEQDV